MIGQRQLVVAVEATGALGAAWPVLLSEYVDKIVRAFVEESNGQKNGSSPGEMALVVFNSHGTHAGCLLRQSGWTSSMEVFFKWLSAIDFGGGGFSEAAVAEALAEALMMCCPGPKPPAVPQQKHCLLIAASNPYRLPTPVIRPPILLLPNGQPELQSEQWWLADAEAVAKAFPPCQVSLSVIAPRQLPLLRSIYNGAKRNTRATETGPEVSKQHLVLISEGFLEGKLAIRRAAVASNTTLASNAPPPSGLAAKLEPLLTTANPTPPQTAAVRPLGVSTTGGSLLGRQAIPNGAISNGAISNGAISNGATGVSMDNQPLMHNNASTVPLPMQHPTTSGVSGADTMQTSDTSASSQAKVAGNPSTLGHTMNSLTQPHKMPGATTLGSVVNGGPAGASVNNPTVPSSLTSGQATILPGTGSVITGLGPVTSVTAGMNTGIGHSTIGGGTLSANSNTNANSNLVGPTGSLVTNQLGPSAVSPLQPGVGPIPVSGAGQSNPLGVIAGMGGTTSALATAGVNAGVNAGVTAIPPTSGLAQPVQTGTIASAATPPQQPPGALKYTKLWEGILAGQRQQKPVPICKLEGYRQTSASEKLAADWPPTMQIVRLIAQDYMNSKEYQGKAELLVFRPLSQHGFLVQLAEKKLCAVIQLPSQTLLLASTDKPGRMIGMLFPGDMVVFKPSPPTSTQQQPTGAVAPMAGTGPAMGQTLGQSNFSQGQLQGQMNPQQMSVQQMNPQQLNAQQMSTQQMNPQQMGGQQLNPQQMGGQQLNPQQLGGQQLNPQQMNVQQLNPQQMNVQHMNSQQMSAQQMNPQQTRPQIMPGPVSLQGSGYSLP